MRFYPAIFAALMLSAVFGAENGSPAAGWGLVSVPGTTNFAGFAWYRAWVKVPDSYFAPHERNLFEESVGVYVTDLAGAHEVWMNAKKIGGGGEFPPKYRSGRDTFHRHKVPVGTLRKGAWNEIAIRVYQPPESGPGGFLGDAPFIMDYFLECEFGGNWEFRLGEYTPGGALTNTPSIRFRSSRTLPGQS